ncbi:hypothetical protein RRG08_000983 [Elysia crispata]|uniref:Uncharacterized protein n=1 Tax=Elysia crispata TaxID=231223 RepID=A0AAE1AX08_9GAST|nr:hypothetical protein RRG08_000983 [Elysia crispata]
MEKKILSSYRYQELPIVGPTLPSQADRELPLTPLRVNRTIIGSHRGRGQYPGNSTIAVYRVTLFWDSTGSYSGPSPSCNIQSQCLTVCWVLCLFRVPWDLELNDLNEYNRCLSLTQRWVQQYSGMIVLEG